MERAVCFLLCWLLLAVSPALGGDGVRLVVGVVLDQFPEWVLERYVERLPEEGGIRRLIEEGCWYRNAWYPQATTVTAVGHSVLATGATPRRSGILGNSWYDPASGRQIACVVDPRHRLVGVDGVGSSPHRLRVPTVGDVAVGLSAGAAKVVSVGGKDRSAILTAGHAGKAFWYSPAKGGFVTSTYYLPDGQLPQWLEEEGLQAARYAGSSWELGWPLDRYRPASDVRPGEPDGAAGRFPHPLPQGPGVRAALRATPYMNELILRAARAAIEAYELGADQTTDLLWVCLSATDTVGHAYGPLSLEYQDCLRRTDLALGKFLSYLDEKFGAGGWAAVLSADHGVAPVPEAVGKHGLPSDRARLQPIMAALQEAFYGDEGEGDQPRPRVIAWASGPFVGLNAEAAEVEGISPPVARRRVVQILRSLPQVFAVYDADRLREGDFLPQDLLARSLYEALPPDYPADVAVVLKPYVIFHGGRTGTTHGSPHSYDAMVPVLLRHPALAPRAYDGRVWVNQVAATLAKWLKVPPPGWVDPLPASLP